MPARRVSPSIRRLMGGSDQPVWVILNRQTGTDDYNQPTWDGGDVRQAHLSYNPQTIRGADGQEILARVTVYLDGPAEQMATDDTVTLPDGSVERVIWVQTNYDRRGAHATVLYLE